MTALELFFYISLAVSLQIAAFSTMAFFRHWRVYQNMKSRLVGFDTGLPSDPLPEEILSNAGAGESTSWEGFRAFRVTRKEFEDKSQSICSFQLEPVDGGALPTFKPGQFLTFQLIAPDPVSGEHKPVVRCYSLSDRPGLNHYRISIKRVPAPDDSPNVPPGLVSNYFHDNVQEGDVLQARAPGGHFSLQTGNAPVVLIAGGIGITPILSMLNASLQNGNSREIWLFYGVRNSADHFMKKHLQALAKEHPDFRLRICYSRALADDALGNDYWHDGHIDIALLRQTLSLKPYRFYVCGPRAMMESLIPALDEWGVSEQNIYYEAFGPASLAKSVRQQPPAQEGEALVAPVTVTFAKSGKSIDWNGSQDSLLEFAEKNGIAIASGCRAGGCGSCQVTIEEGEVEYLQSPDFDPDPGCCLLCVSRPKRNLILQA